MEKSKRILVLGAFGLVIFGFAIAMLLLPDAELSFSERRRLAQFPAADAQSVYDSQFSGELEEYLLDQFPGRDAFRAVKALTALEVLGLSDNNGLYVRGRDIYKLEYPLKEGQVLLTAAKVCEIIAAHPEIGSAWYSIIPDKNYYSPARDEYPAIDYSRLVSLMGDNITSAKYIDIFNCLDADSYYSTDTHWRQEELEGVLERLSSAMDVPYARFEDYEVKNAGSFTGILAGQAALSAGSEEMYYLSSAATCGVRATSTETGEEIPVYDLAKFSGMEPYDLFLSGAQAIVTIENEDALTDRELVIFRDSFGGSLIPLMIDSYSKITAIDLRYAGSGVIDNYVDFEDADVLFIYSTMLINAGGILK